MMYYTHLAFGFLTAVSLMNLFNTGNRYIFLSLVLVGSLLPDLDHPDSKFGKKAGILSKIIESVFGHRGLMHTFYIAAAIALLIYYIFRPAYGIAIFLGYMSHLVIDGFTKQGINFLHPLSKLHLSGFVETGSVIEKGIAILIVIASVMIIL